LYVDGVALQTKTLNVNTLGTIQFTGLNKTVGTNNVKLLVKGSFGESFSA